MCHINHVTALLWYTKEPIWAPGLWRSTYSLSFPEWQEHFCYLTRKLPRWHVSTPGFLSPWRNHLTLTCVLPRNLGKAYASWGNSWITRGLKQAHHLFFLSPALALHCLLSFREFPGQETTASLIANSITRLLFTLSSSSCLYPWLHTLRSHCHISVIRLYLWLSFWSNSS